MSTVTSTAFHRFRAGDEGAFDGVLSEYSAAAYSIALQVLGDAGLAEEAVQEAMVRVWKQSARFDPARGNERTWILSIVRNQAIDVLRKRARRRERSIEESPSVYTVRGPDDVWQSVVNRLDGEKIRAALEQLPPEQAETIRLAYFRGLRPVEIARESSTAEGTVRSRLRLGLARLRELLAAPAGAEA